MDVVLRRELVETIRRVVLMAAPMEACGFLLGRTENGSIDVANLYVARNAAPTYGWFCISDGDVRRAFREAAHRGVSIAAVFHSHPTGESDLSDGDLEGLSLSKWPWVIVTTSEHEVTFTAYENRLGART